MKYFFIKYGFPIIMGIVLTFIPIIFITKFSLFPLNNESASIGSAIGGITAPFVGLIGAFLIYYTFRKQQENINAQERFQYAEFLHNFIKELKSSFLTFRAGALPDPHRSIRNNQYHLNYLLTIMNQYGSLGDSVLQADVEENQRHLILQDLFMWYISSLQEFVIKTQQFRNQDEGRVLINPALDSSFNISHDNLMVTNQRISDYLRN